MGLLLSPLAMPPAKLGNKPPGAIAGVRLIRSLYKLLKDMTIELQGRALNKQHGQAQHLRQVAPLGTRPGTSPTSYGPAPGTHGYKP